MLPNVTGEPIGSITRYSFQREVSMGFVVKSLPWSMNEWRLTTIETCWEYGGSCDMTNDKVNVMVMKVSEMKFL